MREPEDYDDEYIEFLRICSERCDCCPECNQKIPCDGVLCGGLCDEMCDCESNNEFLKWRNDEDDFLDYEFEIWDR